MSGSSASLLPKAFPSAEFIDGEPMLRQIRRVKSPEEIEAIRASVRVAEHALAAATAALVPGVTERQLTAIFMEAMAAAGVTTPSGQDVAWITSRQDPWRRTNRDTAVQPGDLVAFEAGVVLGGYSGEVGRTLAVREGVTSTPSWPSGPVPCGGASSTPAGSAPPSPGFSLRTMPPASPSRPCRWRADSGSASTSRSSPAPCRSLQASSTSRRAW